MWKKKNPNFDCNQFGSIPKFHNGFYFIYLSHRDIRHARSIQSFCVQKFVRDNARMHNGKSVHWCIYCIAIMNVDDCFSRYSSTNVNFESTKSVLHTLCARLCAIVGLMRRRWCDHYANALDSHKWWSKRALRCIFERQLHAPYICRNGMVNQRPSIQIWHAKHAAILAGLPSWWLGHLCWWMHAKCAPLMAHLIFDRVNFNVNVNATSDKRAKYGQLNVCKVPYCWLLSGCVCTICSLCARVHQDDGFCKNPMSMDVVVVVVASLLLSYYALFNIIIYTLDNYGEFIFERKVHWIELVKCCGTHQCHHISAVPTARPHFCTFPLQMCWKAMQWMHYCSVWR